MMTVMTIVKGRVPESNVSDLEKAYNAIKADSIFPPGLRMSFLARDTTDRESYFILTVWESREALEKMRSSKQMPAAVAVFRSVNVEPQAADTARTVF